MFADGVACALVCGDEAGVSSSEPRPSIVATDSKSMDDLEDVMGWDVKNDRLHVVVSKSIPSIVENWFEPLVTDFLSDYHLDTQQIDHFIAHPGGKKVLAAYEKALGFDTTQTAISRSILKRHGNMSSPSVLYVLEEIMKQKKRARDTGLLSALGLGFSGEVVLLKWT